MGYIKDYMRKLSLVNPGYQLCKISPDNKIDAPATVDVNFLLMDFQSFAEVLK